MRLLLDTHVLLWVLQDSRNIGSQAKELIELSNEVFISAASIWEIQIESQKGKLIIPKEWVTSMEKLGFIELPMTWKHAQATRQVELPHQDPFDRMLLAQARSEQLVLATADETILRTNPAHCLDVRI